MHRIEHLTQAAFLILVLTALSACGAGGYVILTGHFVDAAVGGIAYETPSLSGVTDANGTFEYRPGETVRFLLGDLLLGESAGKATITPFDLAGVEPVGNCIPNRLRTWFESLESGLRCSDMQVHTLPETAVASSSAVFTTF